MFSTKSLFAIALLAGSSQAFTAPAGSQLATRATFAPRAPLFMGEEPNEIVEATKASERGVSIDQDGKSNVWAIEPKVEIENKSSEEKTGSAVIAVGGFAAFAAVAAVVLSNLPDPDQF